MCVKSLKEVIFDMLEVSFDVMQSAALAALVAMVGRAVVKRVKFFQTYCIPGVIVAGLMVSFILGVLDVYKRQKASTSGWGS